MNLKSLKLLSNRLLIALIMLFLPTGYEVTVLKQKIIKEIAQNNGLFKKGSEQREILKNLFSITERQSVLLWGELQQVERETFAKSLPILAEIIPMKLIKSFFSKKN